MRDCLHRFARLLLLFALLSTGLLAAGEKGSARYEIPPVIGQGGGVYLLAQKGELEVEVRLHDFQSDTRFQDYLSAYLLTPDRRVVAEGYLSEGGGDDRVLLKAQVTKPGVYLLLVHLNGFDAAWGFSTNAHKYMVARVERSQGKGKTPLRLLSPGEVTLFFQPTLSPVSISTLGLSREPGEVRVVDTPGTEGVRIPVSGKREVRSMAAAPEGEPVWEAWIKGGSLELDVEGVTSWSRWAGFAYEDHGFYTFHRDAFFPMASYRWSLTPGYRAVALKEGEPGGKVLFEVHNHSAFVPRRFAVTLESPAQSKIVVEPPPGELLVPPGETHRVELSYRVGRSGGVALSEEHQLRITDVENPEFTTWSTVHLGPDGQGQKLELPLRYRPFWHLEEALNAVADYPLNQVDFDLKNRPYIRQAISRHESEGIYVQEGDQWVLNPFIEAVRSAMPHFQRIERGGTFASTRTGFDGEGGVYTTLSAPAP